MREWAEPNEDDDVREPPKPAKAPWDTVGRREVPDLPVALTPAEAQAIYDYSVADYFELNDGLRHGVVSRVAEVAPLSHDLSSALQKLPPHSGRVYRGAEVADSVIERYEPGRIVVEGAYTSASRNANRTHEGNVRWMIDAHSGRDIEPYALLQAEREILFDRFARFEVTKKVFDKGKDSWRIHMREVK